MAEGKKFKAEIINGKVVVKAIIVKEGGNVTVHVPAFNLIQKLQEEYDGKRNIQQV